MTRSLLGIALALSSVGSARAAPVRLTLLHTASVAGELVPCRCSDGNYGGLARRVRLVRHLRRDLSDPVFVADTGDVHLRSQFAPSRALPLYRERARLYLRAHEAMGVDVLGLGELDLALGPRFLRDLYADSSVRLLGGNLEGGETEPFAPGWVMVERGGVRVAFLSALGEGITLLEDRVDGLRLAPAIPALRRAVQWARREGADLVVLAGHLGLDVVRRALPSLRGVDVVLAGHTREVVEDPEHVAGAVVVQAGTRGKYLGRLELTLDPALPPGTPGRLAARHEVLRLGDAYPEDPAFREAVRDYQEAARAAGVPPR